MGHVWCTDCESLFGHSIAPNTKQVDNKRLAIDLSALKRLIWNNREDCDEEVDGSKGDSPLDRHVCDAVRLLNEDDDLQPIETLSTSILDMRPTEESLAIKAQNRKWRASKKEQERLQDPDN